MILNSTFIRNITFVLLVGLIVGCVREKPIVALIENEAITLQEFKESFSRGKTDDKLQSVELSDLKEHLDNMINNRLKILAAYKAGLDKDSTLIETIIKPIYQQNLLQMLYETEIVDPVIKESLIREFYARKKKEVVMRKIFFRLPPNPKPEKEEEVKKKAEEVLQKINDGENFAELAKEFSEDKYTSAKGGLTEAYEWTRSDDPIRQAAFSMNVGEISGLIRDRSGYHIIKIEEIIDKKRRPYNELRHEIREQLKRENRIELGTKAQAYWKKVMEKNQVLWVEEGLTNFVELIKPAAKWGINAILDSLAILSSGEKETVLLQYSHGKMDVNNFEERLRILPASTYISMNNVNELKNFIERILMNELLGEVALKKKLDKNPIVIEEVKKVKEREIVKLIMKQVIDEDIQPSDDEVRDYYEEHKEDKYSEPEKVKIQEIMVRDKKLAERINKMIIDEGEDFGELAEKFTIRRAYKKKKGILDYFQRGRRGIMGETAFTLKIGEIAGPIELENNEGFSIIKLLDKVPPAVKPFDRVEEHVMRDITSEIKRNQEKTWLTEQRKVFRVKIFNEELENVSFES